MSAREGYQDLLGRISRWAIEETCGKKGKPTAAQLEQITAKVKRACQKQIFHIRFHQKQDWFMRAKAPIVAAVTGNRFGKTTALLASLLLPTFHCVPWASEEDQEDAYATYCKVKPKHIPPVHVVLCGPDFSNWLPGAIIPKLKEMIPWDALVKGVSRVQGQIIDGIEWWNGSTWKILSYEQDPERFESWRAHAIGWDEPMPMDRFIGASRGAIDFGAPHIMSYTPENMNDPWSYDAIYLKGHHVIDQRTFDEIAEREPSIVVIEGAMTDNPNLDRKDIETQTSMWIDPDVREARITGKHRHLAGQVFKRWDRAKHVRELEALC